MGSGERRTRAYIRAERLLSKMDRGTVKRRGAAGTWLGLAERGRLSERGRRTRDEQGEDRGARPQASDRRWTASDLAVSSDPRPRQISSVPRPVSACSLTKPACFRLLLQSTAHSSVAAACSHGWLSELKRAMDDSGCSRQTADGPYDSSRLGLAPSEKAAVSGGCDHVILRVA